MTENFIPRSLPEATLLCVPPYQVDGMLPIVLPMLDRGYSKLGLDIPSWLCDDLRKGHALLWLAIDQEHQILAAMTTALVRRRIGLVCKMMVCSGHSMKLWRPFHLEIERYAKAEGCVKVSVEGRAGWGRALSGYRKARVVLEKDL